MTINEGNADVGDQLGRVPSAATKGGTRGGEQSGRPRTFSGGRNLEEGGRLEEVLATWLAANPKALWGVAPPKSLDGRRWAADRGEGRFRRRR